MRSEADVLTLINRLDPLVAACADGDAAEATLRDVAQTLYELVRERDMYQARCLAAAKQCDELTLKLTALTARRQKANDK